MNNPFLSDRERYLQLARNGRAGYLEAAPFPHGCFDDFLPPELCDQLLREFPQSESHDWIRFDDPQGVKLASRGVTSLGPGTQEVLSFFNSCLFLEFLQQLTGIEGLIPDAWFEGGGLHQIHRGGFLKIHADFNRHPRLRLDRRINVLLYLNRDWQEEYGGHLELWNRDMSTCEARYLPVFNRLVVFNTTDYSYHGHPQPLNCPETMSRRSLALYYYTNGRPEIETAESHSTLYQLTPSERERMRTVGYRFRDAISRSLEGLASVVHKPAGLLRRIADRVKPHY